MGNIKENIYDILKPLNMFALEQNSFIDKDIDACCVGFKIIEDMLEKVKKQTFVQTAFGEGLCRHESLVGISAGKRLDEKTRRELVIYRLSVAPFDFNLQGMKNSALAAGLDCDLTEDNKNEKLLIYCNRLIDDFADMDQVKKRLYTMLPAHLEIEFDMGISTWNMLDDVNFCWNDWDYKDFDWNEFDMEGHLLFFDLIKKSEKEEDDA